MPTKPMTIEVVRTTGNEDLPLPSYQTSGASGMDLYACVNAKLILRPAQRALVQCGVKISIPEGFEGQIRPRSGLAHKYGVTLLNAPATVDRDYRGELGAILINHGTRPFSIERGMRIAQLVVAPVCHVEWIEVLELSETPRSAGGYGHTGIM